MKWHVAGCLPLLVICLQGSGCASKSADCTYDTDCPQNQVCLEGKCHDFNGDPCQGVNCPAGQVCQNGICVTQDVDAGVDAGSDPGDPGGDDGGVTDPCENVQCPAGQVCLDGFCVDQETDADNDGWGVSLDCDDNNPDIHPGADEVCNSKDDDCDGATDEDGVCDDCDPVDLSPTDSPPFTCDQNTPCEDCARYQDRNYYCRSLNGGAYHFVARPQQTPCDDSHHCNLMVCAGQTFHCDAASSQYLPGGVPTGEAEECNGYDDNCDGATDENADAACPPWPHGTATCVNGQCSYACDSGYHDCGGGCLDDTSTDSCGTRCEPCDQPVNSTATCENGQCGFDCHDGFEPSGDGCVPCQSDNACGPECLPCADNQSCCNDVCIDTSSDPLNCGGCGWACPSTDYTCCFGQTCCAPEQSMCCGNFCCDNDGTCCPGDYCCPAGGNCCGEYCCSPPHSVCCPPACCADGTSCCHDFCCTTTHTVCCDEGCCATGSTCCNDFCCPGNFPICCTQVCCQNGTYCCASGTQCCNKKGEVVPGARLSTQR